MEEELEGLLDDDGETYTTGYAFDDDDVGLHRFGTHQHHNGVGERVLDKLSHLGAKGDEVKADVWKTTLLALFYVILWYIFSIGLTFYNKWLFKVYGLDTPLFVTFMHSSLICVMSWAFRYFKGRWEGKQLEIISLSDWFYSIGPAGATSALDIGLSNMSLNIINITLYTMVKSTVIVWLLISAFIFKIEKPTKSLVVVIALISGGLILFRAKEGISFHSIGFFLVLAASIMGGLRWVLTQLVLHKEKTRLGLVHPVDTMSYITPCIALTLLPFSIYFEGEELGKTHLFSHAHIMETLMWLLFGAGFAFFLTLSEFLLVSTTSGLALSVAGIVKEIFTIVVAVVVTSEHLTLLNVLGLAVSIVGIAYYNIIKYRQALVVAQKAHAHDHDSFGKYGVEMSEMDRQAIFSTRKRDSNQGDFEYANDIDEGEEDDLLESHI
eukprot:m.17944 g.17944  ORF g.17944 m.17944 type:complete len:438 (+) comp4865_c0_seq1:140-1453(+)